MSKEKKKVSKSVKNKSSKTEKQSLEKKSIKDGTKKEQIKRSKTGKADHVIVRNLFAFVISRRLSLLLLFSFICALIAAVSAWQVIKVRVPPQYIQLTEDGRILPIAPLNIPSVSDGTIRGFAAKSVKWLNTYDYINWKDELQEQSDRFTPSGWNGFIKSLVNSDNLNTVKAQRMVVSMNFNGPVRIIKKGVIKKIHTYAWMIEVPVAVNYISTMNNDSSAKNINQQKGNIRLYIVRVPLEINLRGYAIQIYQFSTAKNK